MSMISRPVGPSGCTDQRVSSEADPPTDIQCSDLSVDRCAAGTGWGKSTPPEAGCASAAVLVINHRQINVCFCLCPVGIKFSVKRKIQKGFQVPLRSVSRTKREAEKFHTWMI